MVVAALTVLLATLLSQLTFVVSALPAYKPYSLVLVGGGLDDNNSEVWNKIIDLGGGSGSARFCVIATAGEDPCCDVRSSFALYYTVLLHYGAADVLFVPITVDSKGNNSNPEVISLIKSCTGFFFSGGDQSRITYSFYNNDGKEPSPALRAIKETLLLTGGVAAGTSAGTDVMTNKIMITCGDSYEGLRNGSTTFWRTMELPNTSALTAYGPGGIGLFTYGLLDTHFANRGRQGRMIRLMTDSVDIPSGSTRAFAVDENTALVVTTGVDGDVGELIGERGMLIIDISEAVVDRQTNLQHASNGGQFYPIYNVKTTKLTHGDIYDFSSMKLIPSVYKQLLKESTSDPYVSHDIFNQGSFEYDSVVSSLLSSSSEMSYGTTKEDAPTYTVELQKVKDRTKAFGGIDPATGIFEISYEDLFVSIVE